MEKKERFESVLEAYRLALGIYESLFNKELLLSKTVEHQQATTIDIARTIRESSRDGFVTLVNDEINTEDEQIAKLYFDELKIRGDEWLNADLRDEFIKIRG